jgi:hypothetical protein
MDIPKEHLFKIGDEVFFIKGSLSTIKILRKANDKDIPGH